MCKNQEQKSGYELHLQYHFYPCQFQEENDNHSSNLTEIFKFQFVGTVYIHREIVVAPDS